MGGQQGTGISAGASLGARATAVAGLWLATAALPVLAQPSPGTIQLPLYSADYAIKARLGPLSFHARTSSNSRWDADNGEYRYTTEVEATGIANSLFPGTGLDLSRLRLDCTGLIPLEQSRDDGSDRRDEDLLVQFDTAAGTATVAYKNVTTELAIPPGAVDANSLALAMLLDLIQDRPLGTYAAVDRDEVKTYEIKELGRETIDSILGPVQTLVIEQGKPGSTRSRKIWLMVDHDFLPVKMEYRKKGKTRVVMTLESFSPEGHGPALDCPGPVSNAQPPDGEPG